MNTNPHDDFYIVAYEPGAEHPALPTWANHNKNPLALTTTFNHETIKRIDLPQVPGGYQLLNVLTPMDCRQFIELSDTLGYLKDAAVSLPREVRHNDNVVWVTDIETEAILWQRIQTFAQQHLSIFNNKRPLGLNSRFRFYRYEKGDYFKPHSDGAWPGSRVVNGKLVSNAYPDRFSLMTVLFFLSDDFEGGATRFFIRPDGASSGAGVKVIDVRTPAGAVLCFPHGMHPMHCVHSSEPVLVGTKYIIRTDMLFELD